MEQFNASNPPKKIPQVEYTLQTLENNVTLIMEAINEHKTRLSPILKNSGTITETKSKPEPENEELVPLAKRIYELSNLLGNVLNQIWEIGRQLEI